MTDEQLEKQISEEFEEWFRNKFGEFYHEDNASHRNIKETWQAAALPLMKKIEEMEKENKFQADVMCDMGEVVLENKKLQKENEELRASNQKRITEHNATKDRMHKENVELREALDWAMEEVNYHLEQTESKNMGYDWFEEDKRKAKEIRTKFSLNVTTNELLLNTKNSSSDKEGGK